MRYTAADFVDHDGMAAAKARAPHARQLCNGSNRQLPEEAGKTVSCPVCGKTSKLFTTQKDRDVLRPIVPSHMTDWEGAAKIAHTKAVREQSATPRPY